MTATDRRHDLSALPLRPELVGEEPYGAPQLQVPVRLNVNENPYPPPLQVREAMAAAVLEAGETINRYPDREAGALRADLAAYLGHGLTAENLWAANGSNEAMIQALNAFAGPGRAVAAFTPTYSMYPEYARDTHSAYLTCPREVDFMIDPERAAAFVAAHQPAVVIVTTPNNPTGTPTALPVVAAIAEASTGIVIVDEAYQEFARHRDATAISLLDRFDNLIISRTMSKAFAFAGGRVGYVAASPAIIDALRIVRLPYHLSALTQAVARVALAHADVMLEAVDELRATRDASIAQLRSLGFDVIDSDANFWLFGRFDDRHAVFERFLDHGVLVRETGPSEYLRVCAGTPEEMAVFHEAAALIAKENHHR
ncbi:MAG: histidinol-phosphate transaminase [Propionibacteriaceae bacterium]|nr:histidinol-phosphate transaminase [Propionibacteriaceae bacterium]